MSTTAKVWAFTAFETTTTLTVSDTFTAICNAADKANGADAGTQIHVEQYTQSGLRLAVTTGDRLVELMTIRVLVHPVAGGTDVAVWVEQYKVQQPKLLGLVPVGRQEILGLPTLTRFVEHMRDELATAALETAAR